MTETYYTYFYLDASFFMFLIYMHKKFNTVFMYFYVLSIFILGQKTK
jgi:hypothetical protein